MGARADYLNTTPDPGDARRGAATESTDPAVIAHDIEQTRAEMTGTVNELQERLEPERLSAEAKEVAHYAIAEAKGAVQDLAGQASSAIHEATIGRAERMSATARDEAQSMKNDLLSTIKANPIPAAMTAVGVGWLLTNRSSDSGHQGGMDRSRGSYYYDAYGVSGMPPQSSGNQAQQMAGQVASQMQDRAGQMQDRAGQMQHQLGDTADQVQHRLEDTAGQVQHQAQGFWHMLQSNPIAAAALGLGIGAIAGMVIPESDKEDQLMGETRDRVLGGVQDMAGQTMSKAQHIAEEAGDAAMAEAKSQGVMPGSQSASSSPA